MYSLDGKAECCSHDSNLKAGSVIWVTENPTKKIFENIFQHLWIFSQIFRSFRSFEFFLEIGRAETIRLVRKSSESRLSS